MTSDLQKQRTGAGVRPVQESALDAALGWTTAVVLFAVILSVAWMVVAAYLPPWVSFTTPDTMVFFTIGLLATALLLVSAVALRQTRR